MFFKKIALLSLLLSSLTLASDLTDDQLDLSLESGHAVAVLHADKQNTVDLQASGDKKSDKFSRERPYQAPPKQDYIVGIPPKATYIHQLALQMIGKLLGQLSGFERKTILHAGGLEYPMSPETAANRQILKRNPFFTLKGGLIFMPISSELGLVYRCAEGTSYPETSTIVSSNQDAAPVITNDGIIAATLQ